MNFLVHFEDMGQSLLLAQEGRLLIARAIAAKLGTLVGVVSARVGKLTRFGPSLERWHP